MFGQLKLSKPTGKMISVPPKQTTQQQPSKPKSKPKSTSKPSTIAPKLTTSAPDTVTMGELFDVIYYLEAPGYKNAHIERTTTVNLKGKGSQKGVKRVGNTTIPTLTVFAHFTANVLGDCLLPPFTAEVNDKTYYSPQRHVYVRPEAEYAPEYEQARLWLTRYAEDTIGSSLSLSILRQTNEYILFGDNDDHGFVLVAKQRYWPNAGQPVLAFSTEHTFAMDRASIALLDYYARRLQTFAAQGITPEVAAPQHDAARVAPLLGKMAWGQTAPYNSACAMKDNQRMLAGCLPVAVGQIMRYHAQPDKIAWSEVKDEYADGDNSVKPLAELLAGLGDELHAQYGLQSTSSSVEHLKPVLIKQYGYSPRLTVHPAPLETNAHALIQQELHERRPVLASGLEHGFVIDGCDGGYLHLNLGWEGRCNGWYNTLDVAGYHETKDANRLISTVVTGILPLHAERHLQVDVQKPGDLQRLLSEEDQLNVTHLKVRGKLGGADVALLRRMAGAVDKEQPLMPTGSLMHLDLTEVKWANERTPFLRERMTGITTIQMTHIEYVVSETAGVHVSEQDRQVSYKGIDMSKPVSNKDWQTLLEAAEQTDGMHYHRDGQGYVWEYYTTHASTISPMMFRDCTSLREILLPPDTRKIGRGAFCFCECLEQMDVPAKVTHIEPQAFSYCLSLMVLNYHKKSLKIDSPNFEKTPRQFRPVYSKK